MLDYYDRPAAYQDCYFGRASELNRKLQDKKGEDYRELNTVLTKDGKRTLLMIAVLGEGDANTIQVLLDNGAKIDKEDVMKRNVFHYAAYVANAEKIKCLMDHERKAEKFIKARDEHGRTAIHAICISRFPFDDESDIDVEVGIKDCLSLLLQPYKEKERRKLLTDKDNYGITPLEYAKYAGYHAIFPIEGITLEDVADIDYLQLASILEHNFLGHSPLMEAVLSGDAKNVQLELENAANPMETSILDGDANALHLACRGQSVTIVELLLAAASTKPDVEDGSGSTPLHFAAYNANADMVKLLLDKIYVIQTINKTDRQGRTALHALAMSERDDAELFPTIELLIDKGADVAAKAYKNMTPADLARSRNKGHVADKLERRQVAEEEYEQNLKDAGCFPTICFRLLPKNFQNYCIKANQKAYEPNADQPTSPDEVVVEQKQKTHATLALR